MNQIAIKSVINDMAARFGLERAAFEATLKRTISPTSALPKPVTLSYSAGRSASHPAASSAQTIGSKSAAIGEPMLSGYPRAGIKTRPSSQWVGPSSGPILSDAHGNKFMCLPDPNEMTAISRWPADMQRLRGPIGEVFTRRPMATRTLYTRMRAWVIRLARRFV